MTEPAVELGAPGAVRERLEALTGLRFLAAIHVVLYHLSETFTGSPEIVRRLVWVGYSEVCLFFILSGFVLTYSYGPAGHIVDKRKFWCRRFARLYPTYLFAAILMAPIMAHHWYTTGGPVAAAIKMIVTGAVVVSLLGSWLPMTAGLWNGPAWSLSCEAVFYAAFPFVLPRAARLSTPRLRSIILILWGLAWIPPLVYTGLHLGGLWRNAVLFHPVVRIPEFLIGVCLCCIFLRTPRWRHRWMAEFAALACIVAMLGFSSLPEALTSNVVLVPFYAALIWTLASSKGPLVRALSSRPMRTLGEASYAIYLLQVPVRILLENGARALGAGTSFSHSLAFAEIYVLLLILISIATVHLIERPAQRFLRQRLAC